MAENSRELILDALLEMERNREYSSKLIRAVLDKYHYLDIQERSFMKRVLEGTVERQIELDFYLNHFSTVPVNKMKPLIRCLMRMSVYQLLYMDAVPDSAVCNEACKLAQKRKFSNLKGFVNGVLRKIAREKEQLPLPDRKTNAGQYLSVKYSMPLWLVEKWLAQYGRERVESLLGGLLQIHPVSLRFRSDLPEETRREYVTAMEERGAVLCQSRYLPYVYTATNTDYIGELPGFAEGAFVVQDVSSALAVEAAGIEPSDFVLDACAAPGGKTMLAAEKARRVLSRDVSYEKLDYIQENLERMQLVNVDTQVYDARCRDEQYVSRADVLLLDVPCSGLGIIGKKRDIKYNVTPESLASIAQLQKEIVTNSWEYVRPGGILLYSTCTIHEEENQKLVQWITEQFPFEPVSLEGRIPALLWQEKEKLDKESSSQKVAYRAIKDCMVQLLPGEMEADGFFFAVLRRRKG